MEEYNLFLEWSPRDIVLNDYVYARNKLVKILKDIFRVNVIEDEWFKTMRLLISTNLSHSEILLKVYNIINDTGLQQWFGLYPRLKIIQKNVNDTKRRRI